MKTIARVGALAALLAFAAAAVAGDCGGGGFGCENMCPLAKKAGERRAYGTEGGAASQKALAAQVQRNLAKV